MSQYLEGTTGNPRRGDSSEMVDARREWIQHESQVKTFVRQTSWSVGCLHHARAQSSQPCMTRLGRAKTNHRSRLRLKPNAAVAKRRRGGEERQIPRHTATLNSPSGGIRSQIDPTSPMRCGRESPGFEHETPLRVPVQGMVPPDDNWLRHTCKGRAREQWAAPNQQGSTHRKACWRTAFPLTSTPWGSRRSVRRKLRC